MSNNNKPNSPATIKFDSLARNDILPMNESTYSEFIIWFAMPRHERIKSGIETQKQFAEYHHLTENTLLNWKNLYDFRPRVRHLIASWAKDRTQDVVAAIYRTAIGTGKEAPQSQKLWLQYVEEWNEKMEVEHTKKVEVTPDDVRFLIDSIPDKALQTKFYGYLIEINATFTALRHGGQIQDRPRPENKPENPVPRNPDKHAQGVSRPTADAMAIGDQSCLRTNLERETLACDYQSTSRWW